MPAASLSSRPSAPMQSVSCLLLMKMESMLGMTLDCRQPLLVTLVSSQDSRDSEVPILDLPEDDTIIVPMSLLLKTT